MTNLDSIYPVHFIKDEPIQNSSSGLIDVSPQIFREAINDSISLDMLSDYNSKLFSIYDKNNLNILIKDFIINNISELCNTFMIKILEDYIDKDEIAYIVDFNADYNLKDYLSKSLNFSFASNIKYDNLLKNFCRQSSVIMYSNIIFTLNQFIQFYCMYKLVYDKEGIDLYKKLYKDTYGELPTKEINNRTKYVFCVEIMNNILENEMHNIKSCTDKFADTLYTFIKEDN